MYRIALKVICLIALLTFSCSQEEKEEQPAGDQPGKIKGMGETPGELEGDPFVLPSWFELEEIRGSDLPEDEANSCAFDGTGEWIALNIKFKNKEDEEKLLELPAGITFFPDAEVYPETAHDYQGAMIVTQIIVSVPPRSQGGNGSCNIKLLAFCINANRSPSDEHMVYKFGKVSTSPLIRNLLKLLEKKKVAWSHFDGTEEISYGEVIRRLQGIIWSYTDHGDVNEESIEWIKSLPESNN